MTGRRFLSDVVDHVLDRLVAIEYHQAHPCPLFALVEEQEGDASVLNNPEKYPVSKFKKEYLAPRGGYVESINSYEVGMTGIMLGGGRLKQDDVLDYKAGVRFYVKPGSKINAGQPVFTIYTDKEGVVDPAIDRLATAISISEKHVEPGKLVLKYLDESVL